MQHNLLGKELFLQNKFLSVAFNASGTLGSEATAPKGFVTDAVNGYIRLGLMGDTDGFGTGKAAARDGMLGGLPVEGFSLGYKTGGKTVVATNMERIGINDIKGTTADLSNGDTAAAGWSGATAQKVAVDQVVTMSDDAKFMRFEVTLTNNSGSALSDFRYMRLIDPDHGSSFNTVNKVIEQGGDGADGALIAAYASGTSTPMFYYTGDDRARVSSYGLDEHDPYAKAAYEGAQTEGFKETADKTMHIDFALGTLAAGQSTTVVFYLGITDNLDATLATIKAQDAAPVPPPVEVPNVAPEAHDDAVSVIAGGKVTGNVLANDRDGDGDALTAKLVSDAKHGSVTLKADGSFSFVADKGWSGTDSFTYAASDGEASTKATVQVTVAPPPNTAAVAVADAFATIGTAEVTGNVLANDSDADGDALTAKLVTDAKHGSVTLKADGSFSFVADKGWSGTDSFTYAASDGQASTKATVQVVVAPLPNTAAVAVADVFATVGTAEVTGNVLANDRDADGDALTAKLVTEAKHGSVTLKADGSFSFVADKGWSGTDSFTYAASDGQASTKATVQVVVAPLPNTAAVAVADVFATVGTAEVTGNVLANDSDADGDALTASLIAGPAHGSVTVAADGSFRFVAEDGFVGTDSFTYQASDGRAGSTATVTVGVVAPAPVPVPVPEPAPVAPTVLARALLQQGTDAANQVMTATTGRDTFYFDTTKSTGADKIAGFGANDVLATSREIYDGNGDGIIKFSKNKLALDAPGNNDTVSISGVSSLRALGQDADGTWLYANATVRPKNAQEGVLGNQSLSGDATDKKAQTFFFDTGLDIDLGHDQIANFGKKDVVVTTVALSDGDTDRKITFSDGHLDLSSAGGAWSLGAVEVAGIDGSAVTQLEFDGTVKHGGTTYYVYSLAGSAAGVGTLGF